MKHIERHKMPVINSNLPNMMPTTSTPTSSTADRLPLTFGASVPPDDGPQPMSRLRAASSIALMGGIIHDEATSAAEAAMEPPPPPVSVVDKRRYLKPELEHERNTKRRRTAIILEPNDMSTPTRNIILRLEGLLKFLEETFRCRQC
jgi:hypothetical protein